MATAAQIRSEYLFAPQDSEGFHDMNRYKDTWGYAQTRISELIVTTKVKGGNVLTATSNPRPHPHAHSHPHPHPNPRRHPPPYSSP